MRLAADADSASTKNSMIAAEHAVVGSPQAKTRSSELIVSSTEKRCYR
jgi:hypothetical protein